MPCVAWGRYRLADHPWATGNQASAALHSCGKGQIVLVDQVRTTERDGRTVAADYAEKPAIYFAGARADFVNRLPVDRNARILEIGCGSGDTAHIAKSAGVCGYYAGVELFPDAASQARKHIDEVVVGDVETLDLAWAPETFDALILSEVLEHLRDPWIVTARLAKLVKPGGLVLASSPNVSHWRVLMTLARGRFPRHEKGVFDRTHLRWFTPSTFVGLFEDAGFKIEFVGPVTPFSARTQLISKATGGRFDHLFMVQVQVTGRKR